MTATDNSPHIDWSIVYRGLVISCLIAAIEKHAAAIRLTNLTNFNTQYMKVEN